ncbi:MAG TPA: DNA topoisomerase IV subunit B, partial [Alphaproteobacteria bacterium]
LFLAQPPLYRLSAGPVSAYAMNDAHKEELLKTTFKGKSKVDTSRFKGLGEMPARQLKETTMDPCSRTLIRVTIPDAMAALGVATEITAQDGSVGELDDLVERLMGRNADARYQFIQDNARFVEDIDV